MHLCTTEQMSCHVVGITGGAVDVGHSKAGGESGCCMAIAMCDNGASPADDETKAVEPLTAGAPKTDNTVAPWWYQGVPKVMLERGAVQKSTGNIPAATIGAAVELTFPSRAG